jgi:hypothetical protein
MKKSEHIRSYQEETDSSLIGGHSSSAGLMTWEAR